MIQFGYTDSPIVDQDDEDEDDEDDDLLEENEEDEDELGGADNPEAE